MTGMASLLHHPSHVPAGGTTTQPMANSSSGTGSAGSSNSASAAATISANDFLTLLVTEMQNQDPTANTDPNEYVNQLVNVNSLEQLISINQTLSGAIGSSGGGTTTGTTSGASGTAAGATQPASGGATPTVSSGSQTGAPFATATSVLHPLAVPEAAGNLTVPRTNPAAARVAQALGGGAPLHP